MPTDGKKGWQPGKPWRTRSTSTLPDAGVNESTVEPSQKVDTKLVHPASIRGVDIFANTITANNIQAGTITAKEIAAGTITAAQIAAHSITALQIQAATITTTEIAANTITASNIAAATITSTQIAAGTITATNIAASTITTSLLAAGAIQANGSFSNSTNLSCPTATDTSVGSFTLNIGAVGDFIFIGGRVVITLSGFTTTNSSGTSPTLTTKLWRGSVGGTLLDSVTAQLVDSNTPTLGGAGGASFVFFDTGVSGSTTYTISLNPSAGTVTKNMALGLAVDFRGISG